MLKINKPKQKSANKKSFKCIFILSLLFLPFKPDTAQDIDLHIGLNVNAPNKLLLFSPIGLRIFGDMNYKDKLGIRTNFAANFHSVKETADTRTLINCFFTQIEFSVYPKFSIDLINSNFGIGAGYYSITKNEQSSHLQTVEINDIYVGFTGDENFDSNIGINFFVDKKFGPFIIEFKYMYVSLLYHSVFIPLTPIDSYSINIKKRKYFHFLNFSLSL